MPGFWSIFLSSLLICAIAGVIIVVLTDERSSSQKILWIVLVSVFPLVGLILYILLGINFRRPAYHQRNHKTFAQCVAMFDDPRIREIGRGQGKIGLVKEEYRPLVDLLRKGLASGIVEGQNVEVLTEGQDKLDRLAADIENARDYVHMEYFYFRRGETGTRYKTLLKSRARDGLKVRFIRENIANFDILPHYYNEMRKAGVDIVKFTPTFGKLLSVATKLNYRDHRKIAIIDGKAAYTGGMNISDDYYSKWRDTHVRFEGEAVAALQLHFLDSLITSGGTVPLVSEELFPTIATTTDNATPMQIVPGDPDTPWPILSMAYAWILDNARKYVWIQTPYLMPPESVLTALKAAALKGTDVRIMVPRNADIWLMTLINRAYYLELMRAGVRIFENRGRFIHSKTFVCDDYLSSVGSCNLDFRSLELSYEMGVYFYDEALASRNKEIFEKDLEECVELKADDWKGGRWYNKLVHCIARLLAPIL